MQTFLPYASFESSAKTLDVKRLGKQRVEVLQIAKCLLGESSGWKNHPAVRMWDGYFDALIDYGVAICNEWIARGYRDTCKDKLIAMRSSNPAKLPPWFGDYKFHQSHQSKLLQKNFEHYSKFNFTAPNNLDYVWPA